MPTTATPCYCSAPKPTVATRPAAAVCNSGSNRSANRCRRTAVCVLSLAFAAPLAALAECSGGFHLLGGSSIGKSSALDLAASVWGHPADWLQRCAQACQQHYGHSGRAFLQRLCAERTACVAELHAAQQAFVQKQLPADAAGQAIRAAQRFALVAYAGELASCWQLSGWTAGVAQQAASQLFQTWLQARGGSHDRELRDGMAAIKAYLERYADSRFTPWDQPDSRTEQRASFCRQREDGPYFYVLPQAFRSELCNGHDPLRLARALATNGWLKTQSPDRLTVKTRLPGMGRTQVNVYLLTPLLWQGGGVVLVGGSARVVCT